MIIILDREDTEKVVKRVPEDASWYEALEAFFTGLQGLGFFFHFKPEKMCGMLADAIDEKLKEQGKSQ